MGSWWRPWSWFGSSVSTTASLPIDVSRRMRRLGPDGFLQLSAVLCGVRVISEGVAMAPLKVYRQTREGGQTRRRPATDLRVYDLLYRKPNEWMTAFEWRELMTVHAVVYGNAFSMVNRVGGKVDELIPIHPRDMQVSWDKGVLSYRATVDGRQFDLSVSEVFHLRGPSMDGRVGLEVMALMRDMLYLTAGLEGQQIDLQEQGGRPSGILSYKGDRLSPESREALREAWVERFGPDGRGGVAVLDEGWSFTAMQVSQIDQQHLESRRFQIEEVARALRVQPLMIMQASGMSYASAEQLFQAHVVHTLMPWFERWEQALDRVVLPEPELYAYHNVKGLMRGTAVDRAAYYEKALGAPGKPGWMTQNEVRDAEGEDRVEDGDWLNNGNLQTGTET
ncbi:phage portal protein [Paroceanicella profunda]|uniref:Phage portal protein n=1 Tax=Paroceanicella profunda TaxID=2579971 RepID=A0A5B8FYS2_9RHOB|nr:phage portal protein [Paroceanicella profunda]QDL92540.1 phage portal protein [Paroceanicella profunda]